MIYRLSDAYYVRALQLSDLDGPYAQWLNDQEICRYNSHGKFFKDQAALAAYVNGIAARQEIVWAICHQSDGHVGNISLQSINWINRSGELAIVIGEAAHWGTGAASLAAQKLLHHGFEKLNLNRIHCGTAANNHGMIKLAQRLGMQQEGCRRQHFFLEGEWVDMLEFGILRAEYADDRHLQS